MTRAFVDLLVLAGAGIAIYAVSLTLQPSDGTSSAPIVVTVPQRQVEPPAPVPAVRPQPATATPANRASLARELQRELQRVGCYDGEINGVWTTSTRMAMKTFTDRVNAKLPIDAPDYILLSLVQGQKDTVCGPSCPAGQVAARDGRCTPSATLAEAGRKAPVEPSAAETPRTAPPAVEKAEPAITRWAPTAAALAPAPTAPPIRGNAALTPPTRAELPPVPDNRNRPTAASAQPEAQAPSEPAQRADRQRRSAERDSARDHGGPVPPEGVYRRRHRRSANRVQSKPPKFVRSFLRSVQRSLAPFGIR
ncbi:MAG: hypothetical protein F9K29_05320 [Hyphomicrobiaceae bacterium]|nr:MAG: hypothetical protein F9K29_05320 [Hyphomicrobiaceae bacterium]